MADTQENSKLERIEPLLDALLKDGSPPTTVLDSNSIDISAPNFHGSKKEFLAEKKVVTRSIKALSLVLECLLPEDDDSQGVEIAERLRAFLDTYNLKEAKKIRPFEIGQLMQKNIAETGFSINSLRVVMGLWMSFTQRLEDLHSQEEQFWDVKNRPPNYHARTIALRLARLYARRMHRKPTFGTAREGNHPSTGYARALQEIFEIVGFSADVRGPAEWAISQLTIADTVHPLNRLAAFAGYNRLPGLG